MKDSNLERIRREAEAHLAAIQDLFRPGWRATVIVRNPDKPDGTQDFLLTDDNLDEVSAALELLKRRPESGS